MNQRDHVAVHEDEPRPVGLRFPERAELREQLVRELGDAAGWRGRADLHGVGDAPGRRGHRVLREFEVITGTVAPANGQVGGGTAYILPTALTKLVADGWVAGVRLRPPVRGCSGEYSGSK